MNAMSRQRRKYELKSGRSASSRRVSESSLRLWPCTRKPDLLVRPSRRSRRRAGVQRLTVYNNFPDEKELFAACQGQFFAAHPPPDPTPAFTIEDPAERLHAVLSGLYAWFREAGRLIATSQRDRSLVPALDTLLEETVDRQLGELAQALVAGWSQDDAANRRVSVIVAIALDFGTWQRMADMGLDDSAAAELIADIAVCASKIGALRTNSMR